MYDFTLDNTADDESNSEKYKRCSNYNRCYLQVRNNGTCFPNCDGFNKKEDD